MEELKPCPRCGGEAELVQGRFNAVYISCDCGIVLEGDAGEEEEMVQTWNTRPIEDALRTELERTNSELRSIESLRSDNGIFRKKVKELLDSIGKLSQQRDALQAAIARKDEEIEALNNLLYELEDVGGTWEAENAARARLDEVRKGDAYERR